MTVFCPTNSINLHSPPIMWNCQDTSSILADPPDAYMIVYGQPIFWLYRHNKVAATSLWSSTLIGRNFLHNKVVWKWV